MSVVVSLEDAGVRALRIKRKKRARKNVPMVTGKGEYKSYWVFRRATAEVRSGECVALIDGSNGDRATSLLRVMTGLINPDEGSWRVRGQGLLLTAPAKGQLKSLSVRQATQMLAGFYGMTDAEVADRVEGIMAAADLADKPWVPAENLEGYKMKQLAFSAAMTADINVMGVQNMSLTGSPEFRAKCVPKLRGLMERGSSLVIHEQNSQLIEKLATRALLVRKKGLVPITTEEAVAQLQAWAKEGRARRKKKRRPMEEEDHDDDTTFM